MRLGAVRLLVQFMPLATRALEVYRSTWGGAVTSVISEWDGMQVGWELVRGADAVRRLVSWSCMLKVELAMA